MNRTIVIDLCADFLCMSEATHDVHVLGGRGHVLKLCEAHTRTLQQRAREEGVEERIEIRRRGS
jgi:hypothetical protein